MADTAVRGLYTMTVEETMEIFRRYGIPMSQARLTEMLQSGACPFAECYHLSVWVYTIWRLKVYRYLAARGIPVTELREHLAMLQDAGWDPAWEGGATEAIADWPIGSGG